VGSDTLALCKQAGAVYSSSCVSSSSAERPRGVKLHVQPSCSWRESEGCVNMQCGAVIVIVASEGEELVGRSDGWGYVNLLDD